MWFFQLSQSNLSLTFQKIRNSNIKEQSLFLALCCPFRYCKLYDYLDLYSLCSITINSAINYCQSNQDREVFVPAISIIIMGMCKAIHLVHLESMLKMYNSGLSPDVLNQNLCGSRSQRIFIFKKFPQEIPTLMTVLGDDSFNWAEFIRFFSLDLQLIFIMFFCYLLFVKE